jgi:hypothetical protein
MVAGSVSQILLRHVAGSAVRRRIEPDIHHLPVGLPAVTLIKPSSWCRSIFRVRRLLKKLLNL